MHFKRIKTTALATAVILSMMCPPTIRVRADDLRPAIQGNTEWQKTQGEEIESQEKAIKEERQKTVDKEKNFEKNISRIKEYSAYLNQHHITVPVGTSVAVAEKVNSKIPVDADEKLLELAKDIESDSLQEWCKNYTLEKTKVIDPEADITVDKLKTPEEAEESEDTTDISPLLVKLEDEVKNINTQILEKQEVLRKYDDQLKDLEGQKDGLMVKKVFDPNDVTIPSNLTAEELHTGLDDTRLGYLTETFIECEHEYGVNAVFLASIAAHESGWGTSRRAINDHNYTGFGVYSNSAVGINDNTGQDNIRRTAEHLANNYLSPDGKYYNGVSVRSVHTKYCATGGWTDGVCKHAETIMNKILKDPVHVSPEELYQPENNAYSNSSNSYSNPYITVTDNGDTVSDTSGTTYGNTSNTTYGNASSSTTYEDTTNSTFGTVNSGVDKDANTNTTGSSAVGNSVTSGVVSATDSADNTNSVTQGSPFTGPESSTTTSVDKDNNKNVINITGKSTQTQNQTQPQTKQSSPIITGDPSNMVTVSEDYEVIDGRAYYNQGDPQWNNDGYSMSSAGCGPVAMAIVVSSLTPNTATPLDTAKWGSENGYYSGGGSQHEMIPAMAEHFGVACEGVGRDETKIRDALKSGGMAVVLMGSGTFTRGGHFIVLSSIDDNDMVTVLDVASRERTGNQYPLSQIIDESKTASAGGPFWIMAEKKEEEATTEEKEETKEEKKETEKKDDKKTEEKSDKEEKKEDKKEEKKEEKSSEKDSKKKKDEKKSSKKSSSKKSSVKSTIKETCKIVINGRKMAKK